MNNETREFHMAAIRTSNSGVAEGWSRGTACRNGNGSFSTDGRNLFSYSQKIGFTSPDGRKVLVEYTAATGHFISQTTSGKHISPARRVADEVMHPSIFESLEGVS